MWAHPGKQLLFMGGEFGQGSEWADSRSLDWWLLDNPLHRGLQRLVGDLNRVYRATPALWTQDTSPAGFSWIDANDASNNTFSFLRWGDDGSVLACVVNFAGGPHEGYRLGPAPGGPLGGGPQHRRRRVRRVRGGQPGRGDRRAGAWHGQPASATLRVPPLGALWLRYTGEGRRGSRRVRRHRAATPGRPTAGGRPGAGARPGGRRRSRTPGSARAASGRRRARRRPGAGRG